ncbi:hypothetical protein THII_2590 [Thioploca ingrica]|uniref:DUF29 domain-containing protein n=1 Tax=Thioploca ingrica TaxID=40754 RepID=A0A090AM03_9GAMM|nr:hypothetical protein THII_2590 [Thioploca ingrica]
MNKLTTSYEQDFYAWTRHNAQLLREGKLAEIDMENIAEELESMGKSEQRELINRLIVLLAHLLKWEFQPDHRSSNWNGNIIEQRRQIKRLLQDSPSLKRLLNAELNESYLDAILDVANDTGIPQSQFSLSLSIHD